MEKTSVVTGLSFIHNFQDSLCLSKVFNLYANVECSYIQLYFPQVRFFSGHTTKQEICSLSIRYYFMQNTLPYTLAPLSSRQHMQFSTLLKLRG